MEDELAPLSASNVRIMALFWADILAAYAMWILMAYLTDVWDLNFTSAAAIVNLFMGVSSIMPIGAAFLVDALMGNFWMLILSSSAYSVGLGFLSMSTPPVLSKATGTCSSYKEECIGNVQKALFYTSLPLNATGMAGHIVSLNSFLKEQNTENNEGEKEHGRPYKFLGTLALIIVVIASAIALPYIKLWSVRFGIPAICILLATIAFISGSGSYDHEELQGSPYTRMFRVFVAFLSKIHLPLPTNDCEFHGFDECIEPRPHASRYRCLDRAAIISPSKTIEEQRNEWKLCSVTEVDETRIALRLIPMSMTFIFVGLITSIGNTYFLEQANHMNPKIGKLKFPLPILLLFYESAKSQATKIYNATEDKCGKSLKKYAPAVGFTIGMLLSILCCITAAKVEERRIRVIKKHGLLYKPDETIPMSMFWLLPQFLLLGALDGIARRSITCFYRDQIPESWDQSIEANGSNATANQSKEEEEEEEEEEKVRKSSKSLSMRRRINVVIGGSKDEEEEEEEEEDAPNSLRSHMIFFTWGVFGTGTIGGVLSVYIVGRISKRGGRRGWFQDTLNKSRLDNYYWTLAVLSSVVLVLYVMVAMWYTYRESSGGDQEDEPEEETNCEEILCCCCY